ncbi:hydrolase [Microvirga sp. CF3016]|uniref:hydrolase n=1 Tax=Microvirga sp. CF3016 TaxID=3110181 RepID=UPI002E75F1D6|nr:hydrolase [Microvirga sp. CF3016]MEE1611270.1 hydrolase [Microvirga sp. CF3016]
MLLDAKRSQLLVVDLQARLMPAIHDGEAVLRNVRTLLEAAKRLGIPVTVTEQYPQGLGATVPPMQEALPTDAVTLAKTSFSAVRAPAIAERVAALRGSGLHQLVVCGTEAHICVLQSALEFRNTGLDVYVVADAVSSRSQHSVAAACARLLHAGCHWVTTEMAVFEWMGEAATDDFRALAPLFR